MRKKEAPSTESKRGESIPHRLFAQASPRSIGGVSLFETEVRIKLGNVHRYFSRRDTARRAAGLLEAAGFEVLQVHPLTINFAGSPETFQRAFKTELARVPVSILSATGAVNTQTFVDDLSTSLFGLIDTKGTNFYDAIEGIAIEEPRVPFAASPTLPSVDYWHLSPSLQIANLCNASPLHALGITGAGVKVAMVDSGFYRHPFFSSRGYSIRQALLAPGAEAADEDANGHGTGELTNIVAVAPKAELIPVKVDEFFSNTIAAFNLAAMQAPQIISCSWGGHKPFGLSAADRALEASVAAAVRAGIVVVFAAGNGQAGFPGQMPQVLSAGGVYVDKDGAMQVSDYASAFASLIYSGRSVPDVSGLVGMKPRAMYIMLPVEPGCRLDVEQSAPPLPGLPGVFPHADQTAPDDGWSCFSGTSAAAPQLAGCAALLRQLAPQLWPWELKVCCQLTARPIADGVSNAVGNAQIGQVNFGLTAWEGGAGAGLIDASAAAYLAYLRLIGAVSLDAFAPPLAEFA